MLGAVMWVIVAAAGLVLAAVRGWVLLLLGCAMMFFGLLAGARASAPGLAAQMDANAMGTALVVIVTLAGTVATVIGYRYAWQSKFHPLPQSTPAKPAATPRGNFVGASTAPFPTVDERRKARAARVRPVFEDGD